MTSKLRVVALFFLPAAIFAQHGGGGRFRGGSVPSAGFRSGGLRSPGFGGPRTSVSARRFAGHRSSNSLLVPFYPFGDDYLPPSENVPIVVDSASEQCGATTVQPPPPTILPAVSVIHNYKWSDQPGVGAGDEPTFTIALKDGSRRSAATTWVQDGRLHYIDAHDKQVVLSSDLIERDTTQRLNREKNLHMQLPPG